MSGYDCFHCGEGTLRYYGYDDAVLLYKCDTCGHFVEGGVIALLDEFEANEDTEAIEDETK
jgi:hypothetical protein